MFSQRTQVLLSPDQVTKLKRIAARDGRSVGAVIRDAVDSYVDPGDDARHRAIQAMLAMNAPVDDWEVMKAVDEGRIEAVTSAEVVQEILHRFLAIRRPDIADALARNTLDTFFPVLPITHALMRRVPDLARRYPDRSARDLIHVATCIHEGITEILSADRGFDVVREVRRIPPEEFAAAR